MQVIAVRVVVIWPQDRAEAFAGAALNGAKKFSFGGAAAVPVVLDANSLAVFQYEGRYINSIGGRMG